MKRLLALLLFLPVSAFAWTRASDERIAEKSATLAPPDLRIVLTHYAPSYKTGIARAQSEEGTEAHHYFVLSRSGKLRERIQAETTKTISMLRKRESMAQVVEHLGILAHLVADANNPFHVGHENPRLTRRTTTSSSTSSAAWRSSPPSSTASTTSRTSRPSSTAPSTAPSTSTR
ncbi:MAG TPA: hypothetical protein VGJ82_21235 [Thermoanaerobaculia bacterium]